MQAALGTSPRRNRGLPSTPQAGSTLCLEHAAGAERGKAGSASALAGLLGYGEGRGPSSDVKGTQAQAVGTQGCLTQTNRGN